MIQYLKIIRNGQLASAYVRCASKYGSLSCTGRRRSQRYIADFRPLASNTFPERPWTALRGILYATTIHLLTELLK